MSYNNDPHDAGYAKAIAETDKAILVVILEDKFWIPKSVIHEDSEVFEKGGEGHLVVMEWWAENGHLEDPVEDSPPPVTGRNKFRRRG